MTTAFRTRTRAEPNPPSPDVRRGVTNAIYRLLRLRVRWDNLDVADQRALVDLAREADGEHGIQLATLPAKKRKRFEQLSAKAAGLPADHFEQRRKDAQLRAAMAEIGRQAKTPPRRVRLEQEGSIVLRKEWVFDFVARGVLWPTHVALLVYVMAIFENGAVPKPAPGIDYDGRALTVDTGRTAIPPDPGDSFAGWKSLLEHLATNKFIDLEKQGRVWKITPGSRLRTTRRAS
jgi:hypothetical protein